MSGTAWIDGVKVEGCSGPMWAAMMMGRCHPCGWRSSRACSGVRGALTGSKSDSRTGLQVRCLVLMVQVLLKA